MEATGAIGDYTHLWWDVRPHPRFGTLELRVMDCQTRIEDTIALAAYVQCLVEAPARPIRGRRAGALVHRMLLAENKWLAPRYGLDAPLMDLVAGQAGEDAGADARQAPPARAEADRPRAGLRRGAGRIELILENGTGAERQLQVWNANRDIGEVA